MKYFHGGGRKGPYFEGWYLKHQNGRGQALALIPAIHIDRRGNPSASIQVISRDRSWWVEYPAEQFRAVADRFDVRVGECFFSERGTKVDIEREGLSLHGCVEYGPLTPLRSDIMGPFRLAANMQCRHGVISMRHPLSGLLTLNGETFGFDGGTGYIETDRGRSFPKSYLWSQCAWEGVDGGSVMMAAATVPFYFIKFRGCICAVLYRGREYRIATYRGAVIEKWTPDRIAVRQGKYLLMAELLEGRGQALKAPRDGGMDRTVRESLGAKVRYRFWLGDSLLFDHVDTNAGFEQSAGE